MPDTLHVETFTTNHSTTAEAPSAGLPDIPSNTSDVVARLYRKAQAAADALEGVDEEPEGPLHKKSTAAMDRFIEAPVKTMGDILLKLEHVAYYEDLEAAPRLILNRTLLNLLRDLRTIDAVNADTLINLTSFSRGPDPAEKLADMLDQMMYTASKVRNAVELLHRLKDEVIDGHRRGAYTDMQAEIDFAHTNFLLNVAEAEINAAKPALDEMLTLADSLRRQ